MEIPSRLFLAAIPFRADFIKLLVIPLMALEAANVIEAPVLVHARCQGFDAQIEGYHLPSRLYLVLPRIDERSGVVAACVPADRHFPIACWWGFGESRNNRRIGLIFLAAPASCGQQDRVAYDIDVHGWVAEREKLMPGAHAREARLFARGHALEEGLHRLIQPEIGFRQQLAIHLIDVGVVLPAFRQRLLGVQAAPTLSSAESHYPPVVEAATLALHHLQGRRVLLANL